MWKIKAAGIYIIECGEYYYIGMSVDIFSRWGQHYNDLKMKKHSSPKLQEMFDEKGLTGLTFRVLEYISITEWKKVHQIKGKEEKSKFRTYLLKKEKEWMKMYSVTFSLNNQNKSFS